MWRGSPGKTEFTLYTPSITEEDTYSYLSLFDYANITVSNSFSCQPNQRNTIDSNTIEYSWCFDTLESTSDILYQKSVKRSTNSDPRLLQILISMQNNKLLLSPTPKDKYLSDRIDKIVKSLNDGSLLKSKIESLTIDKDIPPLYALTKEQMHNLLAILRNSIFSAYLEYPKKIDEIGFYYYLLNLCRFYRNAVHALYEYSFETAGWKTLFSNYSWYKASTKNPLLPSHYQTEIKEVLGIEEEIEYFLVNLSEYSAH